MDWFKPLERDRYCHRCGNPLTITEIGKTKDGHSRFHISCPNCGYENKDWVDAQATAPVPIVFHPLDSGGKPPGVSPSQWTRMERQRRLNQLSISEKIGRLTFSAHVFPSLQPRLLLASYSFGEGIRRVTLPSSPPQKLRVIAKMVRQGLRKGPDRAMRMSDVMMEDQTRREPDARYVEFRAHYEGPEYDAATEKLHIEERDFRAPQSFGKPRAIPIESTIRTQLMNFVPFGPPDAFNRDFSAEWNRYFNQQAVANAPVETLETRFGSGETALWEVRRFDFPVPLAHAHTLIGESDLTVLVVGQIANDLEAVLPTLVRLEADSAEATMLEEGRAAFAQHRMTKARERREGSD